MNVGARIRELREERGMPGAELARRANTYRNTIHRIETGQTNPSTAMLERIAHGLGASVSELFSEKLTEETFPPKAERRPEQSPLSRRTLPTPETVVGERPPRRMAKTLGEIDVDAPRLLRETYGHAILNRAPEELSKETGPAQIGTFIVYVDKEFRWLRRHYKNRRDTESLWQSKERRRQLDYLYQQHMEVLTDALSRVVPLQTAEFDKEPANQ